MNGRPRCPARSPGRALAAGIALAVLTVAGCGAPRGVSTEVVPRVEPKSRYGNPTSYVVHGRRYYVRDTAVGYRERGVASWYGPGFHGRRTSSGEPYDMYAMTAAHRSLPLPTYVRVTNLANGRSVVLRVNDRGPFVKNRLIDLSYSAARELGILADGTGLVEVEAIVPGAPPPAPVQVEAAPAAPPADVPAIWIQLGAFSNPDNARGLQERLIAAGELDVHVAPTEVDDRQFYRVRMGPLPDVAVADRTYSRLEALGFSEHRIVVD